MPDRKLTFCGSASSNASLQSQRRLMFVERRLRLADAVQQVAEIVVRDRLVALQIVVPWLPLGRFPGEIERGLKFCRARIGAFRFM